MEDNGCDVLKSAESPFFMSQLLSKLDPQDNVEYGREMQRQKSEETVSTLLNWLQQEANLRSRGKREDDGEEKSDRSRRPMFQRKTDNHALDQPTSDEDCILGCCTKHLLPTCPTFQNSTVSQRWDIVKRNQRCRKCLGRHHTNDCSISDGMSCDECSKNHHSLLHSKKKDESDHTSSANHALNSGLKQSETNAKPTGLCPIQKVQVLDIDGNPNELLAMIDSGSTTSLLSKNAARRLGLEGPRTHLTMNLAGGGTRSENSNILEITIMPRHDQSMQKKLSVCTVQKPCSNARTTSKKAIDEYEHLKTVSGQLHLAGGTVDLLIGTDFADAFIDIHTLSGRTGEPIAKRNFLGWYVLGQIDSATTPEATITSVDVGTLSISEDIKMLVNNDLLGVRPTKLCTCSEAALRENKFIKSVSESLTLINDRIQIKMPWKAGPPKNSNYDIAYKRMLSSEKSFKKKGCFTTVQEEVQKLVDQKFVIEVPSDQVDHTQQEWYLPLQAVFTPEKTTKVRLVFDASAKGRDGLSLNDHLEKGPNYINSLYDVLMAWRWDNVAFSGDIRKMFNQVEVHPDDQIYHRFLWRRCPDEQPKVYQWVRLNFGDKPAPDIATNAINYLANISEVQYPEAAVELKKHTYVDDIGGSKENESEAIKVIEGIDTILSKGQFKIKTWHSNKKTVDQSEDEEESTDLLGHRWNKKTDMFTFKKDEIPTRGNMTKRDCLASIAHLWDPIGLVSPVSIKLRIDLQELWSSGFNWDDVLLDALQQRWKENLSSINHLLSFEFERQLKPANAIGKPELHGFSDGGELAYGAVLFLRWQLKDDTYYCVPIMIKPFVAPLKKKSIPRLELLGCLALTRMYGTCVKALDFAKLTECVSEFWVDSTTVLSWVKTPPKEFRPFVSARVAEIQESVNVEDFRYIRSKSNPADALTRGIKPEDLEAWLSGPEFLRQPKSQWPKFEDDPEYKIKDLSETKHELKTVKDQTQAAVHSLEGNTAKNDSENPILSQLLPSCSTFHKVKRSLAYVLRFVDKARKKSTDRGPLTVEELSKAEKYMFKFAQLKLDVTKLDKGLITQTDEDGIVRAHGRLENIRSLPPEMRNPIVLPKDHPLVELLVSHMHIERKHCGYKSLVHETRKRFWIIGIRSMAKRLTRECVLCRRLRRKPLEQLMGQIPSLRVATECPTFTNTALDMFGPIQIKLNRKTLKEAQVVIFTYDLQVYEAIQVSVGLTKARTLKEIIQNWDIDNIKNTLSKEFSCDFKWEWNVPTASHQNGVVESLIKSVRQALDASCSNQSFTEEQWRTFLAEISYVVNGRPLYPSSDDIWESPPITPNDILLGPHNTPPQPPSDDKVNPRDLTRSTQKRIAEFWSAWMKYFAPTLLPRNKWYHTRENVQVGDLVLEIDPKHRRTKWKMALVVATYPGKDGRVRKVRVKTQTGEYDRPIHKLCLIATQQELHNGNQ